MNVGIVVGGRFEVDDVGDVVDVEAAGGYVGGAEGLDLAGFELAESLLSVVLALVAVDLVGADTGLVQLLGDLLDAVLRFGEDQDALQFGLLHQVDELVELVVSADVADRLVDVLGGGFAAGDLDDGGVGQEVIDQLLLGLVQGGAEEHCLVALAHLVGEVDDVLLEAHVEHPVELVEDQDAGLGQVDLALLVEVLKAAGGGDDQVVVPLEVTDVGVDIPAADEGEARERHALGEGLEFLLDLQGEFPRGGQAERLEGFVLQQRVDDGDQEGARLTGTGRGDAHNVLQFHDVLEGFLLDLGGELPAGGAQGQFQLGVDVPVVVPRFGVVLDFFHRHGFVDHQLGVDGLVDVLAAALVVPAAAASAVTAAATATTSASGITITGIVGAALATSAGTRSTHLDRGREIRASWDCGAHSNVKGKR